MISKPLVAVLVIGDYKGSPLPSIAGATNDYVNVVRAFNCRRRYDIVFATNSLTKLEIKHITDDNVIRNENEIKLFDFKLKWSYDDIEDFNKRIATNVLATTSDNGDYGYDGLIYILSSHGDSEKIIFDSNGEEMPLAYIYNQFDNQECKSLRQRPKVYICDVSRFGSNEHSGQGAVKTTENETGHDQTKSGHYYAQKTQQTQETQETQQEQKVADTTTYTKDSHCCKIFGNSKQQPLRFINGNRKNDDSSLLIGSVCKVVAHNFTFVNSNLGDILLEIRHNMAKSLSVGNNIIGSDEIVLNKQNTLPYDIKFASSGTSNNSQQSKHKVRYIMRSL